jgi:hypothetical protein
LLLISFLAFSLIQSHPNHFEFLEKGISFREECIDSQSRSKDNHRCQNIKDFLNLKYLQGKTDRYLEKNRGAIIHAYQKTQVPLHSREKKPFYLATLEREKNDRLTQMLLQKEVLEMSLTDHVLNEQIGSDFLALIKQCNGSEIMFEATRTRQYELFEKSLINAYNNEPKK